MCRHSDNCLLDFDQLLAEPHPLPPRGALLLEVCGPASPAHGRKRDKVVTYAWIDALRLFVVRSEEREALQHLLLSLPADRRRSDSLRRMTARRITKKAQTAVVSCIILAAPPPRAYLASGERPAAPSPLPPPSARISRLAGQQHTPLRTHFLTHTVH